MAEFVLKPNLFEISSPPGDTLLETLETIGMSQAELAARTGRPRKTINGIIKGRIAVTPETALQFERVLGIPASFWNNREGQYRISQTRQEDRALLAKQAEWLDTMPIAELVNLGWIGWHDDEVEQLIELLKFFGIAAPALWEPLWLTICPALESLPAFQAEPGSVTAWMRKGEREAAAIDCAPLNEKTLSETEWSLRRMASEPVERVYADIVSACARAGIALVVVPELRNSRVRGVTRWITPEKALVQLGTSHDTDDKFWFALFHSLGHLELHGKRDVFVEADGDHDGKEVEADEWAMNLLFAGCELGGLEPRSATLDDVRRVAEQTGLSPGIIVGKMQSAGILPADRLDKLRARIPWGDKDLVETIIADEDESCAAMADFPSAVEASDLLVGSWPGLSAGARAALYAAGMGDEAERTDERLFAEWLQRELANVQSAYSQGYYRDALKDLVSLIARIDLNTEQSPVLGQLAEILAFLAEVMRRSAEPGRVIQELLQDTIRQVNQPTQARMESEARTSYSVAATQTESTLVDEFFHGKGKIR